MESKPLVSVIIPVFNDCERLKFCLDALENQTYPKDHYEVIVVDNASQEDIQTVVYQFGQAIYAFEERPGSYAARNIGISLAKGEVIAFTDADCIPAKDWIEKGVERLYSLPNVGLVGGRIALFFKDANQPTAAELYDAFVVGLPQQQFVEESNYGATANVFTSREVIKKVGFFDATLKSNGDYEWGQRIFSAGYKQIYANDVCVAHPARDSFDKLLKKTRRITGGKHDSKNKQGYPFQEFIQDFIKDFLPPFRFIFSTFLNSDMSQSQKMQIVLIRLFLKQASAWERVRLRLGGVAYRG